MLVNFGVSEALMVAANISAPPHYIYLLFSLSLSSSSYCLFLSSFLFTPVSQHWWLSKLKLLNPRILTISFLSGM